MLTTLFKHWTYRVFVPGTVLRKTYESFQELLAYDIGCHYLMAELENLYYQGIKEDFSKISFTYRRFAATVEGMVISLDKMAPGAYPDLAAYFRKFNFYAGYFLEPPALHIDPPYVVSFQDTQLSTELVGAKSKTMVELGQELNLPISDGFCITSNSFSYIIEYNDLRPAVTALLRKIDIQESQSLRDISEELQQLIESSDIPPLIEKKIIEAVQGLKQLTGKIHFAVRSSAWGEDEQCSFAGQYKSCLLVESHNVIAAYKNVIASKYSPEALVYRINSGLSDEETVMAVMVIPMIDARFAGVMYTADPTGKNNNSLFIHATEGLGDVVVSGEVCPDIFEIDKNSGNILPCQDKNQQSKLPLSRKQIKTLTASGMQIEKYFGEAQDVEWVIDTDGVLTFLQTRCLEIYPVPDAVHDTSLKKENLNLLLTGSTTAASGRATGKAYSAANCAEAVASHSVILLLKNTLPSYVQLLPHVDGVIAESGSVAGHFATVCREFNIPLLFCTEGKIKTIKEGTWISLDADQKQIFAGKFGDQPNHLPVWKNEKNLPFFRKLHSILNFITPLKLINPVAENFVPESCRSMHDIIRFCHEKSVQTMFSIGNKRGGLRGVKKKLVNDLPFEVFLIDVDEGLCDDCAAQEYISIEQIMCIPFQSLWKGLSHPGMKWEKQKYYDWKSYDNLAMSDAFAFQSDADSATYAILAKYYLNINIRFGYHFTVVDTLCEPDTETNYCSIRFAGGGGEFEGRRLRVLFLTKVLERLDFEVQVKGDLLDGQLKMVSQEVLENRLQSLGRLLGVTRQMDMRLRQPAQVEEQVRMFFR